MIVLWRPGVTYSRTVIPDCVGQDTGRYRIHVDHEDWSRLFVLQVLMTCSEPEEEPGTGATAPTATEQASDLGQLSTIQEEESQDLEVASDYLQHADTEFEEILKKIPAHTDFLVPAESESEPVEHDDSHDRMPLSLLTAPAESIILAPPLELDHESYAELAVYPPATNMFELSDLPKQPERGEIVLLQMGHNQVRQVVVKRDDDLLTPEQLKEHWTEVQKAMLAELQTWNKLECFSRRPRKGAKNIIDVRWVFKFKWEVPTSDVTSGSGGGRLSAAAAKAAATPKRTIRARLTVRGFKDRERGDIDRYAGTSTRCSQKVIVSEAVRNGWPICTADISKAFLQGVTYEQLAAMTGEPMREVNFYLPANNIPLLKQIPGFEDFNPQTEVLHCDKPGTGLVDAPRAFSLQLRSVTEGKCHMKSSQIDAELCMRHELGVLVALLAKHVDDLKLTGKPDVVQKILAELQKVFGELKVEWYAFTNCGVRHVQDKVTKEITLDQVAYASNLRCIAHPQLTGSKHEDLCCPALHQLYMSLLGAVAYLSHTRVDVVVFICAGQRFAQKPQIQHVRRLNKLLLWIQRNPKKLIYRRFQQSTSSSKGTHLRMISDAAYKKETDDGYSLRGALYCRGSGNTAESFAGQKSAVHIVDWACK